MQTIIIGTVIGILIGSFIAMWQIRKRGIKDRAILRFLEAGQITVNEAREWRNTDKPPARIARGALSPYGDD